ncbi:Plant viral-response family protein [Heracleum sosnowskyi]|uniref:Plant viral-response family protein n=1 Tax=Heracleum sosnowskyi TaxID=360622 RepID=A0AAD8HP31_9APIA|nr:Plant viral-response family protein [Heracleum sosnowskyi]
MAEIAVLYKTMITSGMMSMGTYNLIFAMKNYLKSPPHYSAKPYHPLNSAVSFKKHTQLFLMLIFLSISFIHQTLISTDTDLLLKGSTPVHKFISLQYAAVILLFIVLCVSLLVSESTQLLPFSNDLFFGVASGIFFLEYYVSFSAAEFQISDLQAHCDSVSGRISALSSLLCFLLACFPKLFVADVALSASLILQGFWAMQTGLTLYVDAFVPEGCHKLLDVVSGVEGSTRCDLDDSKFRAVAILDLMFLVHVFFVMLIVLIVYALVTKTVGVRSSRFGSYEALPTVVSASTSTITDSNHIQMKALTGTQA